jgi:hypothetical protein
MVGGWRILVMKRSYPVVRGGACASVVFQWSKVVVWIVAA